MSNAEVKSAARSCRGRSQGMDTPGHSDGHGQDREKRPYRSSAEWKCCKEGMWTSAGDTVE